MCSLARWSENTKLRNCACGGAAPWSHSERGWKSEGWVATFYMHEAEASSLPVVHTFFVVVFCGKGWGIIRHWFFVIDERA